MAATAMVLYFQAALTFTAHRPHLPDYINDTLPPTSVVPVQLPADPTHSPFHAAVALLPSAAASVRRWRGDASV